MRSGKAPTPSPRGRLETGEQGKSGTMISLSLSRSLRLAPSLSLTSRFLPISRSAFFRVQGRVAAEIVAQGLDFEVTQGISLLSVH